MGIGRASGENRATVAANQAIESPLIEVKIEGAKGVLFSVAGGYDMSMSEIQEAAEVITAAVSPDANIIFGASIRPELQDEIVITVVATGFDSEYYRELEAKRLAEQQEKEAAEAAARQLAEAERLKKEQEAAATAATPVSPAPETADFTANTKGNIWDSIEKPQPEEDLDIPPSLRSRLKR